eukprot:gnl/TRDRNA2_/TRDRNA2_85511_c0_seq1.p1 gnl/TRDRNA2_/TRDRNA2_85511_c0~~gnl/TRDRNA2_/TRDRNA2_85511_c0_seq1.p1  ORF type:complete len:347 (+),score=51.84 gnl/TRDRNA2_/TRDRNA2_85511_c0_seq1:74-1114(+)
MAWTIYLIALLAVVTQAQIVRPSYQTRSGLHRPRAPVTPSSDYHLAHRDTPVWSARQPLHGQQSSLSIVATQAQAEAKELAEDAPAEAPVEAAEKPPAKVPAKAVLNIYGEKIDQCAGEICTSTDDAPDNMCIDFWSSEFNWQDGKLDNKWVPTCGSIFSFKPDYPLSPKVDCKATPSSILDSQYSMDKYSDIFIPTKGVYVPGFSEANQPGYKVSNKGMFFRERIGEICGVCLEQAGSEGAKSALQSKCDALKALEAKDVMKVPQKFNWKYQATKSKPPSTSDVWSKSRDKASSTRYNLASEHGVMEPLPLLFASACFTLGVITLKKFGGIRHVLRDSYEPLINA